MLLYWPLYQTPLCKIMWSMMMMHVKTALLWNFMSLKFPSKRSVQQQNVRTRQLSIATVCSNHDNLRYHGIITETTKIWRLIHFIHKYFQYHLHSWSLPSQGYMKILALTCHATPCLMLLEGFESLIEVSLNSIWIIELI